MIRATDQPDADAPAERLLDRGAGRTRVEVLTEAAGRLIGAGRGLEDLRDAQVLRVRVAPVGRVADGGRMVRDGQRPAAVQRLPELRGGVRAVVERAEDRAAARRIDHVEVAILERGPLEA